MTQKEATRELHDRVRQCLTRHQFITFGDLMEWWHTEDFDIKEMEAGEQGMSKFSTEIMWLIGQFGPKTEIDHKITDARKVPTLKKVKVLDDEFEDVAVATKKLPKKTTRKRKKKKKPSSRKVF